MQLEGISVLFSFIGGLGMFLYGMHVMANGLQHFAGGKMQRLMSFLTQNRLMAILVGTLVTAELFCDDSYGGRLCQCRDAESVAGGRRHYGCKHRYDDHRVAGIPERVRQFFEPGILCAPAAGNRRICHFICKIRQKETDR